ncbi:PAS domain-containing protein [Paraflavitalea speifideaquila]|uniref:PAS domain-containing protein n=1 Tax=Paraflavitalea speifideaquila TaxID=3076558 RepID=UPI0028F130A3|nr:PAS domain-containing protein [Paraflavitalea speifideiaquila]
MGNILKAPIGSINRKSDHELWITMLDGLIVYDTQLKDITWIKLNNVQENLYYGVSCIDEHQRIWYGNINGIQCFNPAMQQFTSYSFEELYGREWAFTNYIISDSTGRMLTACPIQANGLYVFDKLHSSWTKLPFNRPATAKNY